MKSFRIIVIVSIAILFSGCPARSFYPLFAEKDLVFNPSLLGSWIVDKTTYTFEKTDGNQYKLVISSQPENDSAVYAVSFGRIGASWFLDSYPIVHSQEHHYLSMHVITKMSLAGDTLRLASLEADWLSKMIIAKKFTVTHIQRENEIILTASTNELQKFIASIDSFPEAFPDPDTFVRLR